jgi:hypothetical protein
VRWRVAIGRIGIARTIAAVAWCRAVHLVQILLPLYDNAGAPLPRALYDRVREELAGRFGGLTAFTRAPGEGHWRDEGETKRDDIVVFEVMTETLDLAWWGAYRRELEQSFRQEAIVIRAQEIQVL